MPKPRLVKLKDLIEFLKDYGSETAVVVASDSEGNSFAPLDDAISLGKYHDGQFLTYEDIEDGCEPHSKAVNALCLWPM